MKRSRIGTGIIAVVMFFSIIPAVAFGATELSNIEWWNFRNNEENNGVTDRETPIIYNETSEKWANQVAPDFNDSCTPPLILDGYIYTAQDRYVYKLSKETGKKAATSEKLQGKLGYALNPILYAEGMLFVQIDNGRIQALNAKTLESLWVSERVGGQTLSPITYKNGYIYTGTWSGEKVDGTFFCLSVKDEDTSNKYEVKNCKWKFAPSQKGEKASGFYWAGAYAANNYVAFGSDDGSDEGSYTSTSVFYTVNPNTGAVIDKITGLKGDLRTTTVYHNGHLYFASKGGSLYKVPVDSNGHLGEISSTDMKGMMTAAPVVHNGRIYIGICGNGGQFNADGGHMFAVVNDEAKLTDGSLAYTVRVPGYPQAAALLSTAEESTDFDKDGKADHRVYLYFTYNAFPGGIYYLTDQPGQTKGSLTELFRPEKDKQQYSISTLSCDKEGTLYYKNDSGYMMAVSKNRAYLNDIKVTATTGAVQWSNDYKTGGLEYDLVTETGTKQVKITLNVPTGMTAKIENKTYANTAYTCTLNSDGTKAVPVTVTKKEGAKTHTRTYTLTIRGKGNNATLEDLKVSTSNTYDVSCLEYNPSFDPSISEYHTDVMGTKRDFVNIWPAAKETKAKIQVYPVENVEERGWNDDGSIEEKKSSSEGIPSRFAVYIMSGKTSAKVKIKVTSENKKVTQTYYMTVVRDASVSGVGLRLDKKEATLYSKGAGNVLDLKAVLDNSSETITWESSDDSIATVDDGKVTAIAPGTATITAGVTDAYAECKITVKPPTITLNKYKSTLYTCKGYNTTTLSATVNGQKNQKVPWKVTQGTKYASVSSTGKVTAKRSGTAIITATANGVNKTCTVYVKVPSLKLSKSSATIKKNKTVKIKVKSRAPSGKITYKSANKRIATVTTKGTVKGKKKGKTYIKVTCNGIAKKFIVRVK